MRTLIHNVRVFDGERTIPSADVLIDGDRIGEPGGPADIELDGTGKTLLPGLIDAHAHAFDGNLAEALRFGVTTEFDLNNLPPLLAAQRRLAADRDDVADLRSSSVIATAPGGHPTQIMTPDVLKMLGTDATIDTVADSGQAKAFVEARLAEGADYLKIAVDDGASGGTRLPVLSPELAAVLVEAAHATFNREYSDIPLHSAGVTNASHAALALFRAGVPLLAGTDCTPSPRRPDRVGQSGRAGRAPGYFARSAIRSSRPSKMRFSPKSSASSWAEPAAADATAFVRAGKRSPCRFSSSARTEVSSFSELPARTPAGVTVVSACCARLRM